MERLAQENGKSEEDVLLWEVYVRPGPAVRSPRRRIIGPASRCRFVKRDLQHLERRAVELIGHREARRCHRDRTAGPVPCDGDAVFEAKPSGGLWNCRREEREELNAEADDRVGAGGFEPMRRTIASMRISNMSNLADCSDYRIEAMEAANALTGDPARNAECMVLAHDRRQSVWALLEKACHEILKANYDDHH